jgi:hypothetical protein
MANVIVLAWIGQILLFFVAWKLLHWLVSYAGARASFTLWTELLVNVVLSILLLVVVSNVTSVWWLMIAVGAIVGVVTGIRSARPQ